MNTLPIKIRPDLEPLPARMKSLKLDRRGYPVPWFVAWINGEPEFRAMDPEKMLRAVNDRLCWVCGEPLGVNMTFVVGPMCGITRTSAEPPSHLECARWSARNCPFLSNANKVRREDDLINVKSFVEKAPGFAIARNPGVTLIWTTKEYKIFSDGKGGALFQIGEPLSVEFYASGRIATRVEIDESIATGIPTLQKMAEEDGIESVLMLAEMRSNLEKLLPLK